eukprot:486724-Lingulodinium_polyedra.AAC.1
MPGRLSIENMFKAGRTTQSNPEQPPVPEVPRHTSGLRTPIYTCLEVPEHTHKCPEVPPDTHACPELPPDTYICPEVPPDTHTCPEVPPDNPKCPE